MIIDENTLMHYGILRRSGRYPWGSGGDVVQRSRSFLDMVDDLRKQGLSEPEIAKGLGIGSTTQLRALKSIAKNETQQADISMAQRLQAKGMSNVAIGKRMGRNESSVRALLAPSKKDKADVLEVTSRMLKDKVASQGWIDVGVGVERHLGISRNKLDTAIARLQEEGYELHTVQIDQLGTGGNQKTGIKVLAPPGTTYRDIVSNKEKITTIAGYSEDGGRSYNNILPPKAVASRRVQIRYADEGGAQNDGMIYLRPGVKDISLGGASYAQVRVLVDGTHYLKGMAMYKDDLPDGVDVQYNVNKQPTGNKKDAMKPVSSDPELPFGAVIRRQVTEGEGPKRKVTSAMNIINEDATWERWSRNLSSQMLSKQSRALVTQQLNMTYERRQQDLESIMALTNPSVRKKLLEEFADSADSASVHLKAAALPRQANKVILPISSLKETEIYAPTFRNGERVALIRHPHGGIFEIPELTVNNKNREAKRLLGDAQNAVAINHKVAGRLSGADFDGDTVIVIPNNNGQIRTKPALSGLKNFDPIASYRRYDGMPEVNDRTKQVEMGLVSNLITDMTIQGATDAELARAVRHSMVVIDSAKHQLNFKQSALDNGIVQLREKYQGGKRAGGSTTLLSKSGQESVVHLPERRPRPASKGGPVDKATGKKVFEVTGASFIRRTTGKDGVVREKVVMRTTPVPKLAATDDAHTLSSGTVIEHIYADHSNKLKALANQARKEAVNTKPLQASPSAKKAYAKEVASLDAQLNIALRNAPLERHAQVIANATVRQKRQANPTLEAAQIKKIENQALNDARIKTGARKTRIIITDSEWEAIQAGALAPSKLEEVLKHSDPTRVKELARPKTEIKMTNVKVARAQAMLTQGFTQAEVAEHLGVSLTTLKTAL